MITKKMRLLLRLKLAWYAFNLKPCIAYRNDFTIRGGVFSLNEPGYECHICNTEYLKWYAYGSAFKLMHVEKIDVAICNKCKDEFEDPKKKLT